MSRIHALAAGLAAAAALTAGPAAAQVSPHVGQWACQMTYTELNPNGSRQSGWVRQFALAVYPNGQYQVQGTMAGAGGYSQFRSQGQWQSQGAQFMARGPEQSNDMMGIPSMFIMVATLNGGMMTSSYEQPDPSRSYVMNRSLTQCQRQG
jgi:hypothetical protein